MTPAEEATTPTEEAERHRIAAERRRIAEVFGDVLPESTTDDVDLDRMRTADGDDPDGQSAGDAALLRELPPHHG